MSTIDPSATVYGEHLDSVRVKARSLAKNSLRPRVKARRSRERFLRKKGVGGPFDDLSPSDVEKLRKDGVYDELLDVEGFRERVTELEVEKAGWLDEILLREDDAVIAAIQDLPADVELENPSFRPDRVPAESDPSILPVALPGGEEGASAVTPQSISLPNAEGSIEGMGESFSPVLSSGTATFSVPIAVE